MVVGLQNTHNLKVQRGTGLEVRKPTGLTFQARTAMDVVSFEANKAKKETPAEEAKFKPVTSFVKGFLSPITDVLKAIIEKPAQTALVVGSVAAIVKVIKPARLILSAAIAAYGSYKIGSGFINAKQELKDGNKALANKAVEQIGEGVFDVGLTTKSMIKGAKSINATRATLKAMAVDGTKLTLPQKVYAFLTLPTESKDVLKVSSKATIADAVKLVLQEGIQAIKDFKTGAQVKASESISKAKDAIKNGDAKAKVAEFFKGIKGLGDVTANADRVEELVIDAINTLDQMDGTDLVNFLASAHDEPDSLIAVKELHKRGRLDQVAEKVTETIGSNRFQEVEVTDKIKPLPKK